MNTQRRDTDREPAESVKRLWQIYADEIGIPEGPAGINESLPRRSEDRMQGRRRARVMAQSVGRLLAAVAVVMVAVIAGIALWPESPSSPALAPAPAGEADRIAQRSAPGEHRGDRPRALAPAMPAPSEMVDPPRRQPSPDVTVFRPMNPVPPPSAVFRPDPINFGFASDGITDESKRTLDKIVVAMKANPDWRVAIEGHTDAQGTPDYNRALSERRAQAATAYLQSAGVAPKRLSAAGFGASRPVAPNDAVGNVLNRRVEFHRQ